MKQHKSGMYTTGQGNYHKITKCIKMYVDVRFDLIIDHSWLFYFVPLPMKGRGVEGRGTQWHDRPIKEAN